MFFSEDNSEYASGVRQSARIAFDEEVQKPKRTVSHQLEPVKLEGVFFLIDIKIRKNS